MLLQFELCGQDTSTASYAFRLQQALQFTTLKLKDVRIVCGNDLLAETWSYTVPGVDMPTRTLTAPLYLTMDFLDAGNVAHYMPAVFPAGDSRVNTVEHGLIHRFRLSVLPVVLERAILQAKRQYFAGVPRGRRVADERVVKQSPLARLHNRPVIVQRM